MNEDRQELTLQEQKHLVAVDSMDEVIRLFGVFDENLKVIEEETGAVIKAGADCIDITGPEEAAALAETVLDKLLAMLRKGENIDRSRIRYAIDLANQIEHPVHSISEVNIGFPGVAEHDRVAYGFPSPGMTGLVIHPLVGFHLRDQARQALPLPTANKQTPQ